MHTKPPNVTAGQPATALSSGNKALRAGQFTEAIVHYVDALRHVPALGNSIFFNLQAARQQYRASRGCRIRPSAAICGWELAHNAAGRVFTLSMLYETFAEVEIIGSIFPNYGREIWGPIRETRIAKHYFIVEDESRFLDQAMQLVAAHPYDIVHLSKPRAPNIFFGILYKLIWDAKVVLDIDDEELAFVGEVSTVSIEEYIKLHGKLPELKNLAGKDWTQISVGLAKEFDGVTVCNSILQKRYGGSIIPHARDEKYYTPSQDLRLKSRRILNIQKDRKVVMFFGTPRNHKGVLDTARAISFLNDTNILFCVVGDFPEHELKERLQEVKGCEVAFFPDQPFNRIPLIISSADCCVIFQDENSPVSMFQTPAKLSDALAMGLVVIASRCGPLADLIDAGVCLEARAIDLAPRIKDALYGSQRQFLQLTARDYFLARLSRSAVSPKLRRYVTEVLQSARSWTPSVARYIQSGLLPPWAATWRTSNIESSVVGQRSYAVTDMLENVYSRIYRTIASQQNSPKLEQAVSDTQVQLKLLKKRRQEQRATPLVSVVMPTFNRAATIADSVLTVLQQTYSHFELLVCDDESTDGTHEVIAKIDDARVRYLNLPKGGAAAARNAGLAASKGSIIAYLDSDNFWHPDYLMAMVTHLCDAPGRSAIYCDYLDFKVNDHGKYSIKSFRCPEFNHEALLERPFIDLNSFIHRRELYDCFGGFNPKLTRRQDYDLILKYTWLRDPLHLPLVMTLYQRNESLMQITKTFRYDASAVNIINSTIDSYLKTGLPLSTKPPIRRVTILSWDLCRNHFSKPFALAEALSTRYDVQLISFRFFDEEIFPPLKGEKPGFETLYLPGNEFPSFFDSMTKALAAIRGEVIYVVKPRLPSLGLALLANQQRGLPIILEINDLETVVSKPTSADQHRELDFDCIDLCDPALRNPYSDLWSQLLDPIAKQLPLLVTHNKGIDEHFGWKCLYMRNLKDEAVYDPSIYDRENIRAELGFVPGDRVILFGGLLRKHKGIYELVELLQRLNEPRYKLLFVGSRSTPDQERLVAEYGHRITMLPPQDRKAMARINLASDIVILWLNPEVPASHYQFPYKASDALSMGTPIIANDISDLGDLARQGYLLEVPFGDWDAMTKTIRDLFDDSVVTNRIRNAGKRLFRRQFSYAAARSNFEQMVHRVHHEKAISFPVAQRFAKRFYAFREILVNDAIA